MSRSSRPNLIAQRKSSHEFNVWDLNGSGRAYRVVMLPKMDGICSIINSRGAALNPRGTTACEARRAINHVLMTEAVSRHPSSRNRAGTR